MRKSEAKTEIMEGQALKLLERLIKKRLETKERIQKPNEDHVTTR